MIIFRVYSIILLVLGSISAQAQFQLEGKLSDQENGQPIQDAEIFSVNNNQVSIPNKEGIFTLDALDAGEQRLIIFGYNYQTIDTVFMLVGDLELRIKLQPLSKELSEVVIQQQADKLFNIKRLQPVEGTSIYAGKKNEVVLVDQLVGSMATNNARQIYAQVVGLNIYENADAGLQLNIGGRGLDPNRTANFNTRQNGYDISADVLGYPESYYTPPAEALQEIQVIRGAASLQYGTQFGGMINFKMKSPVRNRKIAFTSRQTLSSFNLFSSFNSLSGTLNKFSYYTYYQYKSSDGFRPNSAFDSHNFFGSFNYAFSDYTTLSVESTYLYYLAQQPGGLTDAQFDEDPDYSNRTRNWFEVDWRLIALKLKHKFTTSTDLSINLFGLNAERNALGFRGIPGSLNSNPITDVDERNQSGDFVYPRDLIKGEFRNWGTEIRLLTRYNLLGKDAVLLLGTKYYNANNTSLQGPGSNGVAANFSFRQDQYPDYPSQSDFRFPNRNLALFTENIFFINDKLTVTPGIRAEYIKTESDGVYNQVNFDNAGNPIFNQSLEDDRSLQRSFILLGIGTNYELSKNAELYANISQNYRSVTFSDIRVVNPTFIIDPNISDEQGYTTDIGVRGKWKSYLSYDIGTFGLLYDDRIGIILDDRANRVRKNIGKAFIYGFEGFLDWNLVSTFRGNTEQFMLNWFINASFTNSEYIESEENNVVGNQVEFIPNTNIKTGIQFGYKNLLGSIQYTSISQQFTDVENSPIPDDTDNRNGIIGEIPGYNIIDLSLSYRHKAWRLETGINNILDESYFTRRATGYPGPGIIPSDPRNFYCTLQLSL